MERRPDRNEGTARTKTVVDPRTSLALWLRAGRGQRGMSLEDVARVTKIQARILERLEAGTTEGLPADVFVRGFVRSVARCLGLDEAEALRRYAACAAGPVSPVVGATARAMVDAMADLAPRTADEVDLASGSLQDLPRVEAPVAPVLAAKPSKKKIRGKGRNRRRRMAAGTDPLPVIASSEIVSGGDVVASDVVASRAGDVVATGRMSTAGTTSDGATSRVAASNEPVAAQASSGSNAVIAPADVVAAPSSVDAASEVAEAGEVVARVSSVDVAVAIVGGANVASSVVAAGDPVAAPDGEATDDDEPVVTEPWQPRMPAVVTPSVPWRRPPVAATAARLSGQIAVPSLVIDDADPDGAEQVLEEREAAKAVLTSAQRRSFLPPILLDREDRAARQGGLTLAVILLLIAATLTLSYLMRRPSSSGDGVTGRAAPGQLIG